MLTLVPIMLEAHEGNIKKKQKTKTESKQCVSLLFHFVRLPHIMFHFGPSPQLHQDIIPFLKVTCRIHCVF